ncbi:MAG: hypothetical protein JRN62_02690 [Nitrososphaerota archaeon]|jgi:CBS domain containing-hemolysin-like protein|nr:hypothetical protein [Nitrososphaerota archaeon]MDG6948904.1 hypothetical protein [Nitrososphaerota archaeon]
MMVEKGELRREAGIIMRNAIKGANLIARDIAIPIQQVRSVKNTDTVQQALQVMGESSHQRLPVFDNTTNEVIGAVSFKTLTESVC